MKLLEIHVLQSFVPSLLNRDDTGSHKEALFGGVRRARVSSQSWKKAMRDYVRGQALLPEDQLALRSKRLHERLKNELLDVAVTSEEADWVAEAVLVLIGAYHVESNKSPEGEAPYAKRELKSEYLVFLGEDRIRAVADLLRDNWTEAVKAGVKVKKYREELRRERGEKYKGSLTDGKKGDDARKAKTKFKEMVVKSLPKNVAESIEKAFDGSKAVDLALFGRMLADLPDGKVDGAFYVAHSISTHEVPREFDYYTAVDDLKPEDTQGADMIGNTEFNSACYYRYAVLDLAGLLKTLQDDELTEAGLEAFLMAFFQSVPSGKQHAYAAYTPPSFLAIRVQDKAMPLNLANAFEKPVRKGEDGFVLPSLRELDREWRWTEKTYDDTGFVVYCTRFEEPLEHLKNKQQAGSLREAVQIAVQEAAKLLGS